MHNNDDIDDDDGHGVNVFISFHFCPSFVPFFFHSWKYFSHQSEAVDSNIFIEKGDRMKKNNNKNKCDETEKDNDLCEWVCVCEYLSTEAKHTDIIWNTYF